jgi:hypothetical protein
MWLTTEEAKPTSRRKPMARRPYRDALNDQLLECRLIAFTSDGIRDRTEGVSAARPWLYVPFRYQEEDLQEDSVDFYQ